MIIVNKNFSYYLSRFLKEYLVVELNVSNNTIRSYKKTFSLLIEFLVNNKKMALSKINFNTVTREMILDFLNYLENERKNTIQTRNQRLGAIKSFYQYCAIEEIENIENINKILAIRAKKFEEKVIDYLTEEELKTLFDSIDTSSKFGRRDLVLLTLLYDTAARASEIIDIKLEDINLENKSIILHGKGKKQRIVPIMKETKELLLHYLEEFNIQGGYLFNNKGNKYSKNFIQKVCYKYQGKINKNLTPHIFRHTRAVHLLDHGVNIVYIQELLGHTCIETTQRYAKVREKTKFEAIEKATSNYCCNNNLTDWNDDKDLLSQLLNL